MPNKLVEEEALRRVMEDLLNTLLAEELLNGLIMLTPAACDALAEADEGFDSVWELYRSQAALTAQRAGARVGAIEAATQGARAGDEISAITGAKPSVTSAKKNVITGATESTINGERNSSAEAAVGPALGSTVGFEPEQGIDSEASETMLGLWRSSKDRTMVLFALRPSVVQRWRCIPGAVVVGSNTKGRARLLSPSELMRLVADSHGEAAGIQPEGTDVFIDMLQQTMRQISWSLERREPYSDQLSLPPEHALLSLERYAARRDRPFHPVAKAKLGWGQEECGSFTAEAAEPIKLRWIAVQRDRLLSGADVASVLPHELLLSEGEQQKLAEELTRRGLKDTHVALPVHPWQMEHMLPSRLRPELENGACIPLDIEAGTYYATSSVRSLMSLEATPRHVKLPLGIRSLGGLRYLSAIKMMNGVRAESLLRQARELDPVLSAQLYLCEEGRWWALRPEDDDLFADNPRHLSALVRTYPEELMSDDKKRLVPMSALAAESSQALLFAEWLQERDLPNTAESALELFREVAETFGELSLRLLRFGLVPEAHGQNAVLVLHEGKVSGLLLRDHDALRVHVPWLQEAGLADPEYVLRQGVPNSLYHDSPQQLIAFFQMLGIQVNLFSIMDSLANAYSLSEERMWSELKQALQTAMERAALPEQQEGVISSCLFTTEKWPWKQIVRPLLAQTSKVPGSMPYGKGEMPNPLRAVQAEEEVPYVAY
ncbi:IucA/IucC family protein [Paenibacillus massiliensis]|uniref:IucA/IucC family protein n=1 Tax=Paenibacillus massiliensis TaxID=225917 RepID=UPI0003795CEB|nr:IucA/IucC family protein [Paenibacillus massiliensis]